MKGMWRVIALRNRLRRRWRQLTFRPYTISKKLEGLSFQFRIADLEGQDWYDHAGFGGWQELCFVRDHILRQEMTVLECGGHHGLTALCLGAWVGPEGKVVSFEANPANAQVIRQNLELNAIRQVSACNTAVGAASGSVRISQISNASAAVLDACKTIEVPMVSLDDYCEQQGLTQVDLIKIDVEGYEARVLAGARRVLDSCHPALLIEIHPQMLAEIGESFADIRCMLDGLPYRYALQRDDTRTPEWIDELPIDIESRCHLFGCRTEN